MTKNFPVVCPVDEAGKFTAEVSDYAGKQVFEANEPVMQWLKQNGLLVKKEQYTHSYPFCWRTDTPLIYKAMSSWFVKVTDFRDEMVRLNQEINWVPEHIKDGRFGKWLEGARDWSISRNRFWERRFRSGSRTIRNIRMSTFSARLPKSGRKPALR